MDRIYVRINPKDIVFVDRIFEASEGLGIVSTCNGQTGDIVVYCTPDTREAAMEMLKNLPIPVEFTEGQVEGI
ncbi:MAG: DUF4911 domain-containing protein [Clostridia bacterium]|nr:DUF4911 domain-containing protein [Clostridia bacterium]